MKIIDLVKTLGLTVYSGEDALENEINGGYVSDLLSDVMGNAKEKHVWITLQTHKNIMAVASLKDLSAIVLVNGNKPEEDTKQKSAEEQLPILGTDMDAFTITGRIYELLK